MKPSFRNGSRPRNRQRGTVAILVGLTICALIGLLGIVIDLGFVGIRKTELQNAADAAALAGARQLNGTAAGIDAAVNGNAAVAGAIAVAAANASDFGWTAVSIAEAQIRFGPSPDGPWSTVADAKATPAPMRFIKIDTTGIAQGTRPTWFAPLLAVFDPASAPALASTTTAGVAVAGAPVCEELPIFICPPAAGAFKPGQSYFFADSPGAPIGPGNIGYFDPVPVGEPPLIAPGASEMADLVCTGRAYCIGVGTYSSRTQAAFGKMEKAFNTRFGVYQGEMKDREASCRPDTNVKQYRAKEELRNGATAWMDPAPDRQSEEDASKYPGAPSVPAPPGAPLGVHWSAVRPEGAAAVSSVLPTGNYPGTGTPYKQASGTFFEAPTGYEAYAQAGRRIITMAIGAPAACDGSVKGSGDSVPVSGFGRFLLTRQVDASGIYVEYIETLNRPKANAPDIKLFR